jgi:hypothetical protein
MPVKRALYSLGLVADTGQGVADSIFGVDLGDAPIHSHSIGRQSHISISVRRSHFRRARPLKCIAVPARGDERPIDAAGFHDDGIGKAARLHRGPEFQGVITVRREITVVLKKSTRRGVPLKHEGRCDRLSAGGEQALAFPASHEVVKRICRRIGYGIGLRSSRSRKSWQKQQGSFGTQRLLFFALRDCNWQPVATVKQGQRKRNVERFARPLRAPPYGNPAQQVGTNF